MASLYLIPTTLGESSLERTIVPYNSQIVRELKFFIVENIRTARRFIKHIDKSIDIDSLTFFELNEHTKHTEIETFIKPLIEGNDVGIVSEAGCPAVADPGALVVEAAQKKGLRVVPLVGASSILLSLMASGFSGQSFAFNGYLPIDKKTRRQKIQQLENRVYSEQQTQIFIETPYRNHQLIQDLIDTLRPSTLLCIASSLTTEEETIRTLPISKWKTAKFDYHKKPTIFLIYK